MNIAKLSNYASIDDIPLTITQLNCSHHKLTVLPDLSRFTKLTALFCSYNKLTSIDNLPNNIEYIYCSYNQITAIHKLPDSLLGLFCNNNKIKYIKEFPSRLLRIFCSNNKLKSITHLSYVINTIICNNNLLYSLPDIPYSLHCLYCNTITSIYPDTRFYTINVVNNFRFNYYTLKFGHRLLFYLIRKRMNKIKYELLENSAKLMMHPLHINYLLEKGIMLEYIYSNL